MNTPETGPETGPAPPVPGSEPPPRCRMSLNLAKADMDTLKRLAATEQTTVHEAIRRSIRTRWRLHTAANPQLKYPTLPPGQLPEIANVAIVGAVTGTVTLLDTDWTG